MIEIKVKGDRELAKAIRDQGRKHNDAVLAALYQIGLEIMADSVRRTPVDTGRLRSSHYVAPPSTARPFVELGYGTDYAVPVHERVEVFHEVGGPKFLESALNEHSGNFVPRLAELTKRNAERGIGLRGLSGDAPREPTE